MQNETTLQRRHAGLHLEILLNQRERTRPRAHLHCDPPQQRYKMDRAPNPPMAGPNRPEDYRQNPRKVNRKHENREFFHFIDLESPIGHAPGSTAIHE